MMGGQGWRKRGGKSERESERRCQRKCFSRLGLAALIRGMRHEAEACGCHLSAAWHMYVQCHVSHQAHLRCESTEKSMPLRGTKHHAIMRPCDHFRQSAQWCMCGAAHTQVSRQRCSTGSIAASAAAVLLTRAKPSAEGKGGKGYGRGEAEVGNGGQW